MFRKIKNNEIPNVLSYGNITGKFILDKKWLTTNADNNINLSRYCLIPFKTEYYNLIWDFDYKIDKHFNELKHLVNEFDNITLTIINKIIDIIKNTFVYDDKTIQYIYAIKNIGYGVHVYFPNVIVNKVIHSYIYKKTLEELEKDKFLNKQLLDIIFDACVSKANGLRMFYFIKDDNYYYPIQYKSTYKFGDKREQNILLSYTNTNNNEVLPKLKIDIELINECVYKVDNIKKEKDKKNNIIKHEIEYYEDIEYIDLDNKKELFKELLNVLDIKRIDAYDSWISLVCLFKTYGLKKEIIEFSKKSSKYDDVSIKTINNIFRQKTNKKSLTIGSLFFWCYNDKYFETVRLLEKYNINCNYFNIKSIDDIILYNNNKNINYIEDTKYISDNARKIMLNAIYKENKNILFIKSPTGSGKTYTFSKLLESLIKKDKTYTILSIITRRSMSSCHLNAFNYTKDNNGKLVKHEIFHFETYLNNNITDDVPTSFVKDESQFISSLEHLKDFKNFYDIILLDELNSLVNYFYSETLNNRRRECLLHLLNLICNSQYIICADMHISDMCFELFPQKNIYFYNNTFQNKKNISMNIFYSKHNSDNSNLTKISKIIGEKYVLHNKPVLIFTDRKRTVQKIHELLKSYNKNNEYFIIIHSESGTQEELDKLDELSKTKCIISSPKICYGVDLSSYEYEDIYCIYSDTKSDGFTSMHWYQQISRSRKHKNVNIYILDSQTPLYKNKFITYEKSKKEEEQNINNYIYYVDKLKEEYKSIDELVNVDNNIFRNIHYYKNWYNQVFNRNKVEILKIIAKESGYNINEYEFNSEIIKTNLDKFIKENKKLVKDISLKLLDDNTLAEIDIDDKYDNLVILLREKIYSRKKYVNIGHANYKNIICDDNLFQNYINSRLLALSRDDFNEKILKNQNNEFVEVLKDNEVYNKITALFWLEEQLKIKRYDVKSLEKRDYKEIVKLFENNINKLIPLLKWSCRTDDYTENQIKRMLKDIKDINKIQKIVADVYNSIVEDSIKYKSIQIQNNNKRVRVYIF